MNVPLLLVILMVVATVGLGLVASGRAKSADEVFVAGRGVGVLMNASAISGEYLSAASFLGIAGLVMKNGYDALWYPVGYAAGYLFLLLFIAGPLRRFGAYTIPDFAEGRFDSPGFRKVAVVFVLFIGLFYTMPQMKGAGVTMGAILGWPYWVGIAIVGTVITFNVALGGMKGITLVQAFQYWAKLFAISVPFFIVGSLLTGRDGGSSFPTEAGLRDLPAGTKVKVKGSEGAPNNVLATPPNRAIHLRFVKAGVFALTPVVKGDPGSWTFQMSGPPYNEKLGDVANDLAARARELGGEPIEVAAGGSYVVYPLTVTKNGEETASGAKLTFSKAAEVEMFPTGRDVRVAVPNAPPDAKWLAPYGTLAGKNGYPLLWTYSLIVALVCGTAGLPHILVRFYTNPDGRAAKRTTLWVMVMLGVFYVFTPLWGTLGRAAMPELYANNSTDSIVVKLPTLLGGTLGQVLSGVTAAGAFAAFMSTFSGLLVSMSGAFAHDVYGKILRPNATTPQRLLAFKAAAIGVGLASMLLGLVAETFDIATMVGWAFAIGAASYFPLLLLGAWWRGLTAAGAATGMLLGGLLSLLAIVGAMLLAKGLLPFDPPPLARALMEQPAIWAVPLSLLTMWSVSRATYRAVPADGDAKMLRLHAPEALGVSQDYIA